MKLSTTLYGETFTFSGVREALGRANEPRSGDVQAGLAPRSMREMAAAKLVLCDLPLAVLREHPAVSYELDEVTRVVEGSGAAFPVQGRVSSAVFADSSADDDAPISPPAGTKIGPVSLVTEKKGQSTPNST